MKHYIVEDSSFVVAVMDKNDEFHQDAVSVFEKLMEKKDKVKILIPPLGLYEIIVTLSRKGIHHKMIERKIISFLHINEVIVAAITESSAFKHCKSLLNLPSQKHFLRTGDFLIVSLAVDYEAQILTFDKKAWRKVKPIYKKIYYCSSIGKMKNETKDFLNDLDKILGKGK
ncbi:PIN domain-containing protein [bacterium]|nr:PIN domain-containing protein [bacterium]